jgi:xanthine/CO dehydrogenase XdhC/CoxF family maturation factor
MAADSDANELLRLARDWHDRGDPVAIATVVSTWGSAPRAAGSLIVCAGSGEFAGSVSGGCVEVAVIEAARQVLKDGQARLLEFGVSDELAMSVGLACGGRIRVFVEALE